MKARGIKNVKGINAKIYKRTTKWKRCKTDVLEKKKRKMNQNASKERDPKKTTKIWTYVQIRCTLPTL